MKINYREQRFFHPYKLYGNSLKNCRYVKNGNNINKSILKMYRKNNNIEIIKTNQDLNNDKIVMIIKKKWITKNKRYFERENKTF